MKTPIGTYRASRPGYPAMVVHRFQIGSIRPHWSRLYDVAECGPYQAQSLKSSAAHKLARIMIAAGEPDGPIEAFGPEGQLRFTVPSLYAFGKFTTTENPRVARIRHQNMPQEQIAFRVSGGSEDRPATLIPRNASEGHTDVAETEVA